jgi:methylmalonyl-CoA/ethylmalonyl-CoA epimerase
MKILGIEHVAIAVENLEKESPFWSEVLGLKQTALEDVPSQGVITDIYDTARGKIELLKSKNLNSPIANFLKKNGSGIHHICLEVEDINEAFDKMRRRNIRIIGDQITIGAEGYKVIFIHPSSAGGVLVELAEKP